MNNTKIYTKTGDDGKTALVSGSRISKSDSRIDLYGDVDELNSRIGFACSLLDESFLKEINFLHILQSALFDLGSNLACEEEKRSRYKLPQMSAKLVKDIEAEIDRMDGQLDALKNFILPGGSTAAAAIHLARTSARSVERKLVTYNIESGEELPAFGLMTLNRLSDYFFVLARFVNKGKNQSEIPWKPGA